MGQNDKNGEQTRPGREICPSVLRQDGTRGGTRGKLMCDTVPPSHATEMGRTLPSNEFHRGPKVAVNGDSGAEGKSRMRRLSKSGQRLAP